MGNFFSDLWRPIERAVSRSVSNPKAFVSETANAIKSSAQNYTQHPLKIAAVVLSPQAGAVSGVEAMREGGFVSSDVVDAARAFSFDTALTMENRQARREALNVHAYAFEISAATIPWVGPVLSSGAKYAQSYFNAAYGDPPTQYYKFTRDGLTRLMEKWYGSGFEFGLEYGALLENPRKPKDEYEEGDNLIGNDEDPPWKWMHAGDRKKEQTAQTRSAALTAAKNMPLNNIFPGAAFPEERNSIFTPPFVDSKSNSGIFAGLFTEKAAITDTPGSFTGVNLPYVEGT